MSMLSGVLEAKDARIAELEAEVDQLRAGLGLDWVADYWRGLYERMRVRVEQLEAENAKKLRANIDTYPCAACKSGDLCGDESCLTAFRLLDTGGPCP